MRSGSRRLVHLAVLFSAATLGAPCLHAQAGCLKEATIQVARQDRVITLEEGERIRAVVVRYLDEEKPKLELNVFGPGEAFIDCHGTMRLGAWILESAFSDEPELNLSFRVLTNEHFLVRQVIGLKEEGGEWMVTGVGLVTAHLRPE